jgi:NADH:ubiquinone oxidoreductase subunit 3 (subunit A)
MAWADTALFFFLYLQPPVLGLVLVLAVRRGLEVAPLFSWITGARRHRKGARFFECAARPRLVGFFSYEVPLLAFCALFILYDADLLFFLPEVVGGEF